MKTGTNTLRTATLLASVLLLTFFCYWSAKAVPAIPQPLTMTQPDGQQISVRLYGDERGHYYTTLDGEMLMETATGFRYATLDADGVMVAGNLASTSRRSNGDAAMQARMLALVQQKLEVTAAKHPYVNKPFSTSEPIRSGVNGMNPPSMPLPGLFPGSDFPTKGSPKVLVILVEFLDVHFSSATSAETIRKQLTQRHYTERDFTGSAYDYYCDASMNQFTPVFDVQGPVRVPGLQATYGGNDASGSDIAPREMVIQACDMLRTKVDFSEYDNNHDGYVDNVYVIYAGRGEASGGGANTIWPHSWVIPDNMTPTINGVKLSSYACSNEITQNGDIDGIGTFCHEFGHVLGLPDLYSTNYACDNHPAGWALMASGSYSNNSRTPPTLSAWERSALGWLVPTILEQSGDYALPSSLLYTNQAYVIPTRHANEYFTLENRQQYLGDWDDRVPSYGMLVWHIDYKENIWNANNVNNNANHQYADVVEASGNALNPGSRAQDCFPRKGKNQFTDRTTPALKSWDGSLTDITLTDITEDDEWLDDETAPTYDISFKATSRLGVEGIEADNSGITFTTNSLAIEAVTYGLPEVLYLYSIDGRLLATGLNRVTAPTPGLYIVMAGAKAEKILLKP